MFPGRYFTQNPQLLHSRDGSKLQNRAGWRADIRSVWARATWAFSQPQIKPKQPGLQNWCWRQSRPRQSTLTCPSADVRAATEQYIKIYIGYMSDIELVCLSLCFGNTSEELEITQIFTTNSHGSEQVQSSVDTSVCCHCLPHDSCI